MTNFIIKQPEIQKPEEIEKLSLETISQEAQCFAKYNNFTDEQKKVIERMIHSTTCFELIINNVEFTPYAIDKIKYILESGGIIITDTNMIKAGLSKSYLEKHNNKVVCYVSDADIAISAKENNKTRTYIAIQKALKEYKNSPILLACGNAPTFIYSAIETLIYESFDLSKLAILAMPVGFINVEESKDYSLEFIKDKNTEGIVLKGRYGGSPLIVSCLHAIYRLI